MTSAPSGKRRSCICRARLLEVVARRGREKSGTFARASIGALIVGDHRRRAGPGRARRTRGAVRTQAALYDEIDLELSWSEAELPERERTKHVHRLHPYLGKYVPQLVEVVPRPPRTARDGSSGIPFAGSGTTLVEANAFGAPRRRLRRLRLQLPARPREDRRVRAGGAARRRGAAGRSRARSSSARRRPPYLRPPGSRRGRWPSCSRSATGSTAPPTPISGASSSPARPARPGSPATSTSTSPPSPCRASTSATSTGARAGRWGRPTSSSAATCATPSRACSRSRRSGASTDATVLHGDARRLDPPGPVDLVVTSPPYPGLIDYHEQHVYAFELLGLERRDEDEIGRGVAGYCEGIAADPRPRARAPWRPGGKVVVVVNDRRGLYEGILAEAGLRLEERSARHVNRRTGRRNGEYYEDVLVAVAARRRVRPRV